MVLKSAGATTASMASIDPIPFGTKSRLTPVYFAQMKAPDFKLCDENGDERELRLLCKESSVLLVFYPADFSPVCTRQLCDYRDSWTDFLKYPIQLFGISKNSPQQHKLFIEKHQFPFPLLSDPQNKVAKAFGCRSPFMFGAISRAIVLIDKDLEILYQYREPTAFTRRSSQQILNVLDGLQKQSLV